MGTDVLSGAGAQHGTPDKGRVDAERQFWDEHSENLDLVLWRYERGPERNTAHAFDALEPLQGATVLDFACGTGVTSAWLAARGARVTGVDISSGALATARRLCEEVGVKVTFLCLDLERDHDQLPIFDRVFGQMSLHHVDVATVAPILCSHLKPGARGAFVETMESNPVFRLGRRHLVGRFGIHRIGTLDERPLGRDELATIERAFGELSLQLDEMRFFRIINRNLTLFRYDRLTRVCDRLDDALGRWPALHWMSYHRGLVVTNRG